MPETVDITPVWKNTCRFLAQGLIEQAFKRDQAAPVVSLIEHVRYLAAADPAELDLILHEFREQAKRDKDIPDLADDDPVCELCGIHAPDADGVCSFCRPESDSRLGVSNA